MDELLQPERRLEGVGHLGMQVGIDAVIDTVDWNIEDSEMGEYPHFMLKEIFEQADALENAMRGRFSDDGSTAIFGGWNMSAQELRQVDRILFTSCGTAWHACLVAEHLIERFARIPVEVEYASELRYRNAPLDKNTLVFVITQSGETIDTLGVGDGIQAGIDAVVGLETSDFATEGNFVGWDFTNTWKIRLPSLLERE